MNSFRRSESKKPEPKRRAVVVGISYKNSKGKACYLRGSINDAHAIRQILVDKYGFQSSDIELMTDEPGSKTMPTGANIRAALKRMVSRAQRGDFIMFYFSGHGTLIPARASKTHKEEDAIVPCDYDLITSVDFRLLVKELPWYIDFVFVADAWQSGALIEGGKEQIGPVQDQHGKDKGERRVQGRSLIYDDDDGDGDGDDHVGKIQPRMIAFEDLMAQVYTMTENKNHSRAGNYSENVARHMLDLYGDTASSLFRLPPDQIPWVMPQNCILITACQRNEKPHECVVDGKSYGRFTHALLTRLREHNRGMLYKLLIKEVRETVQKKCRRQHPCLYCNDIKSYYKFAHYGLPNELTENWEVHDKLDQIRSCCIM